MPQPAPGPMVTTGDVARAVLNTMREAVPYYLAQVDEDHNLDRGTTAPPRLWLTRSDLSRFAEDEPPILLVSCPGTVGDPTRHDGGHGSYGAWWQVSVGVTAGGATEDGSSDIADRLGAAVLYTLAQQGDMGGLVEETVWGGTSIAPALPSRRLMAVEVAARCYIPRVVDTRGLLPRTFPTDPTDPAPATPTPTGPVRVRVTRRSA